MVSPGPPMGSEELASADKTDNDNLQVVTPQKVESPATATPSGNLRMRPASSSQKEDAPGSSNGMRVVPSQPHRHNPARPRNWDRRRSRGSRGTPTNNRNNSNNGAARLTDALMHDVASIRIRLDGLPTDITTREIHDSLAQHGLQVSRIDILEKDAGTRLGAAVVNIEPAPSRWPPWTASGPQNMCTIKRNDSSSLLSSVQVLGTNRIDLTMKTSLNFLVPHQQSFECRGLVFGMMASKDTMFRLPQYNYRDVCLEFRFFQFSIQLTFNVDMGGRLGVKFYRIPIEFAHLKKVIRIKKEDGGCALVIQLPSAPKIFARMPDVSASHDDRLPFWQERDAWQRQLEITHQPHRARYAPAEVVKNRKTIDICRWTTYYLDLGPGTLIEGSGIDQLVQRLTDYNVHIGDMDKFDLVEPGEPVWQLLDGPVSKANHSWNWFNTIHLPFEVRYQLEACITHGLFNEYSITADFLSRLMADDATGKPRDTDRVRMMLEGVVEHGCSYYNPMDIFNEPRIVHYWPTVRLPSQAAMVRRAVITPTGIYFKSPSVELTNRVLRKYSDLTDRFLRVQFTDELTFGKLWSCQGSKQSDDIYTRVLRVLLNGIQVGDRLYRILAWSNSQFRENGAFFFCANDHVTCDDIRDWMGDLKHIRSVGKFAARMGQCFTTTRQLSGISVPKIVGIEDIQRKTDGHVWEFTDGVGKISPFLARMIAHEQNMIDTPSCFQMRMGGCKGVLVVWPDVPANEVHIRPSQEKFKAPYNGLEIIKVSTFSQATLNRQIIPILSCLGVEDAVFEELLSEELVEYEEAMTDAFKASSLLRQRIDENQVSLILAEMVETFMGGKEPFLWTVLRLWRCWVLQRLKFKAAISIKKSAFLYGCVDELGVLRGHSKATEGKIEQDQDSLPQIFLQVPREGSDPHNTNSYAVITGVCVVGRNPSLHPGDIRVVEAVDVAELHHLKNVVVFPQTGDRDIPSMCSGGDLDGDDYFVLWDERLLPKEWNFPPMHHDAESYGTEDVPFDIAINHMCAFFAQYMKNDSVGLVATAHFAWADRIGPKGDKCLELAKLHSMAVDYVKSGRPAVMHKSLNPKIYPHFMERKGKGKSYRSQKPVGRIYDRVNVEKFAPAYDFPFDDRILTRFHLTAEELSKAREIKAQYDIAMYQLIGQHECPVSEFEIWSTFILSKPRVGTDYKLQEQIGRDVSALKDRFRVICGDNIRGTEQRTSIFSYGGIDLPKLDRFVAAMYKVTHEQVQAALEARAMPILYEEGNKVAEDKGQDCPMPLISFPWLFPKELARLANGGVPVSCARQQKAKDSEDKSAEVLSPKSRTKIVALLASSKPNEKQQDANGMGKAAFIDARSRDLPIVDGDYVRSASGQDVHLSEGLQLCNENDRGKNFEGYHTSSSHNEMSLSNIEAHLATKSPQSEGEEAKYDEESDADEVEMVGSDDDEDEEDALEIMANRLAGHPG